MVTEVAKATHGGWVANALCDAVEAAGAHTPWTRGHAFVLDAEQDWQSEVDGAGHAVFANLGDKRLSIGVSANEEYDCNLQPGCIGVWPSQPGIWPIRLSAGRVGLVLIDPRISSDIAGVPCPLTLQRYSGVSDVQLERLVRLLVAETQDGGPTESIAGSLYTATAVHLHRHYAGMDPSVGAEGLGAEHIRAIEAFIEANLDKTIGVSDLASVAGLSGSHFTRMFKAAKGVTPYRYIMNCRIQRARELLVETDIPIADIATGLGFSDQSHLARVFRQATASTPRAYRLRMDDPTK